MGMDRHRTIGLHIGQRDRRPDGRMFEIGHEIAARVAFGRGGGGGIALAGRAFRGGTADQSVLSLRWSAARPSRAGRSTGSTPYRRPRPWRPAPPAIHRARPPPADCPVEPAGPRDIAPPAFPA
jgi:hypothetical protein